MKLLVFFALVTISTAFNGLRRTRSVHRRATGCVYKGQIYSQGQSWKDGCSFRCTCDDASQSRYTCKKLCVQWNLPKDVCHMAPAPAGKCCGVPSCPPYVHIQYPDGYVPE